MIIGSIHSNGDAVIPLRLRGTDTIAFDIDVVIDTGFNDWLALPGKLIESLGLTFREEGRYALADGSETIARFFTADVEWLDQIRRILVLEMEGGPLLGMAMLRGTHLSIDVTPGGRVEILPL